MKWTIDNRWALFVLRIFLLVLPVTFLQHAVIRGVLSLGGMDQQFRLMNTTFLCTTVVLSLLIYSFRFRFSATAGLLVLILYVIVQSADLFSFGEFDGFYITAKLMIGSWLVGWCWLFGYGLRRSLVTLTVQLAILIAIHIYVIAQLPFENATSLILSAVPFIVTAFWLIFATAYINKLDQGNENGKQFLVRSVLFLLMVVSLVGAVLYWFSGDIKGVEKEWAQGKATGKGSANNGKKDSESMTKQNREGGVDNKDQTKLTGALQRDKQLVFVAKLDNFFDNGIPNPLYFTSHYYTLFDEQTQTFEPDPNMPSNDLFKPDPSQVPLYSAVSDNSVKEKSGGILHRKVVSAEIYKVAMAANSFVAPSTAFFCQPVSVPQNTSFKSAYKAKMWVSELNSAYFIYNPANNPELESFQEERFEMLRTIDKIEMRSEKDLAYYTKMPEDGEYDVIDRLADSISQGIDKPIDKIIAIRNFFTSKDKYGQPLFKYSDNPGVPGLPSASKLKYFLFENRKGYCAYFAGATLFMLRSLGIPSRIAVGYLAVDRSNKNPGWYWFYQDQAHAWVQVYFPDFGWLDFDTTVPDQNTQQAEQPDGTPPEEIPQIYLLAHGRLMAVDTVHKTIRFRTNLLVYQEKEYKQKDSVNLDLNLSQARILVDTGNLAFNKLKPGMSGTAISRDISLKDKKPFKDDFSGVVEVLKQPVPIDELKLIFEQMKDKRENKAKQQHNSFNWWRILKYSATGVFVILFILLLLPFTCFLLLKQSASKNSVTAVYKLYLFRLHMLNIRPEKESILQFASRVDNRFNTRYRSISEEYANVLFNPHEQLSKVKTHYAYKEFNASLVKYIPLKQRLRSWMDFIRMIAFFKPLKK
jgi:hypothetical protein